MSQSVLVLYDFSPGSRQALRVAHLWATWSGAELHLLHNLEGSYAPAMSDQEVRQQVHAISKAEAFNKVQRSFKKVTDEEINPVNVHISINSLATTVNQLLWEHNAQLLFAGLNDRGTLKRLFIGSTILRLLDMVRVPIVTIPKNVPVFQKLALHISVNYHYTFNSRALHQFLQLMGDKAEKLVFLSVLTEDDDRPQATSHLESLKATFSDHPAVHTCLFEGNEPLDQVKTYMQAQTDGVLVVQKRSRAMTDYMFREFFINELVHDASLPLIILPE
ncbi:universal stress protein [Pontibacter sp. E15-1]|uniref:universal stress protein n=1 Tax=Pontibacter sp. E15-1 TaxID=2919918 RepID=UPI001F4FCCAC|nr:universal stress protein [Pontibacter sp. E15-1]MCJ8163460.1 universal stress protein [Pontibacter sp. E15-1]